MATVVKVREGAVKFDLTVPENLTEMGVDGVAQALLGFPSSKLIFHVLTPSSEGSTEPGIEQRKAVLSLSINTLALMQLCQLTLASFAGTATQIDAAASEYQKQLKQILESITIKPKSA